MISRRSILRAAPLLFAAPAIVRISSLMPVRALPPQYWGDLLIVEDVAAISWECSYGAVNVDPRFFERLQHGVPHVARDDRGRALSGDGGKILIFK